MAEAKSGKKSIYASIGGTGDKLNLGVKVGFGKFTKRSRGLKSCSDKFIFNEDTRDIGAKKIVTK